VKLLWNVKEYEPEELKCVLISGHVQIWFMILQTLSGKYKNHKIWIFRIGCKGGDMFWNGSWKQNTSRFQSRVDHGPQLNNYKKLVELIRNADESEAEALTEEEIRIITRVAKTFPTKQEIIDAAHREDVWKLKGTGEIIPYTDADKLTEI